MSHILLITSSPRGAASYSTQVARNLAEKLASDAVDSITVRDLTAQPLPHIDDTFATARNMPPERLTSTQKAVLGLSDTLVEELSGADVIIIAAAMINFGIPSSLKAYIDHVLRPGVTFRYTDKGPEGLLRGKKVYLAVARGGVYSQGSMQALNFQDPYLKAVLAFVGLVDVEVIAVEGVAFGPEAAARSVNAALERVSALAA
ncbi:MAG TPA: FMN-dependent NADH-azoreductase [Steroidobacteraceae bacterium]|nr:FMN-dependent NADH-azoreductase [Steroidobacteraceae bacterium]